MPIWVPESPEEQAPSGASPSNNRHMDFSERYAIDFIVIYQSLPGLLFLHCA
jgi:hypothetical protein